MEAGGPPGYTPGVRCRCCVYGPLVGYGQFWRFGGGGGSELRQRLQTSPRVRDRDRAVRALVPHEELVELAGELRPHESLAVDAVQPLGLRRELARPVGRFPEGVVDVLLGGRGVLRKAGGEERGCGERHLIAPCTYAMQRCASEGLGCWGGGGFAIQFRRRVSLERGGG